MRRLFVPGQIMSPALCSKNRNIIFGIGRCVQMRVRALKAAHLLKAVDLWNDLGLGDYGLHFIRDKEKREVDFLVVKNQMPWMLIEVKNSANQGLSASLQYFADMLKPEHALQVAFDLPYVNKSCLGLDKPTIVPAITFLSQLV